MHKYNEKYKKSLWQFYNEFAYQTGHIHKDIENPPEIPLCFQYVFNWFLQLSGRRQSGFNLQPISYSEIKAFFELKRETPQQWELDLIIAFDNIFLDELAKKDNE